MLWRVLMLGACLLSRQLRCPSGDIPAKPSCVCVCMIGKGQASGVPVFVFRKTGNHPTNWTQTTADDSTRTKGPAEHMGRS
jgi:hypothetical protein